MNEDILKKQQIFDSVCVRKRTNFSQSKNLNLIDSKNIETNIEYFRENIKNISPKVMSLFQKIEEIDREDLKKQGTLFKHFIFTDIRSSLYGAKIIGSAFVEKGYQLGYEAENAKNGKKVSKIKLLSPAKLEETKNNNFYILSSSGLFDQPINRELKKDILKNFNQRPNNIYGENVRFIIMDSGYKEGIDLFDIKYIHIFEPQATLADLRQVIGRGTRLCGQKGLDFHPTKGWELDVYVYDLNISKNIQPLFLNSKSTFELYLKSLNYDVSLYNFQAVLEETVIEGAVDYELNKKINKYIPEEVIEEITFGGEKDITENYDKKLDYNDMRKYVSKYFSEYTWDKIKIENDCVEKKGGATTLVNYTKTQDFIRHFFTPQLFNRGILLWHSVGTGKTCTAIATATTSFETQGYTILWVTRTTLVNDIWKNMFSQVCNETIRKRIENEDLQIPEELKKQVKLLSNSFKIHPMSYRQFTNLVSKKNQLYKILEKINGKEDPLRKTLIIIDEAHKLYGVSDLLTNEKPNMEQLHASLMNSYELSGKLSVKLMLMTATPITQNPMELIQLINLCKPIDEQLPIDYYVFKDKYLNSDGIFKNKEIFMDEMSGFVSYLDRSTDVRQFSQAKMHYVNTNLISDETVIVNDRRSVRDINKYLKEDYKKKKEVINDQLIKGKHQMKKIKKDYKKELEDEEQNINFLEKFKTKKFKSTAKKTVKNHIRKHYKELVNSFASSINKIKELKKVKLEKFGEGMLADLPDPTFNKNTFYNLKYKCGKMLPKIELMNVINSDPDISNYNDKLKSIHGEIEQAKKHKKDILKIYRKELKNTENPDIVNKKIKELQDTTVEKIVNLKTSLKITKKTKLNKSREYKKELKSKVSEMKKTRKQQNKEDLKNLKNEYNENTIKLKSENKEEALKQINVDLRTLLKREREK
jgi:hypothetical protein